MKDDGFIWSVVLAVVFIAVVVLAGSCRPPLTGGTVTDIWREPAHTERYEIMSMCMVKTDEGFCIASVPIYGYRDIPERCWMRVKDDAGRRTEEWPIRCEDIETYEIGRWVER